MHWTKWGVGTTMLAGLAVGAILARGTPELAADDQIPTDSTCTIKIEGMTCAGCAIAVTMAAGTLDGVTSVDVSLEEKQARVAFDPAKTTPAAIARAIRDGTGFTTEPQPTIPN